MRRLLLVVLLGVEVVAVAISKPQLPEFRHWIWAAIAAWTVLFGGMLYVSPTLKAKSRAERRASAACLGFVVASAIALAGIEIGEILWDSPSFGKALAYLLLSGVMVKACYDIVEPGGGFTSGAQ